MNITLYKDCLITLEKPFKVESIDVYLGETLESDSYTINVQPSVNKLYLNVILTLEQAEIFAKAQSSYNYAALEGRYYFITAITWKSSKSVELSLYLDTVNSCTYDFNEKTQILREHKDRFIESTYSESTPSGEALRNIDMVDEGLSPTLYLKSDDVLLNEDEDNNFYLVYRTRDDLSSDDINNPLECYLCSDQLLKISNAGQPYVRLGIGSGLSNNYAYVFPYDVNPGSNAVDSNGHNFTINASNKALIIKVFANTATATVVTFNAEGNYSSHTTEYGFDTSGYMQFNQPFNRGYIVPITESINFTKYSYYWYIAHNIGHKNIGAGYAEYINNIDRFDRTDAKLVKIIKLPYNPSSALTYNATSQLWEYDFHIWEFFGGELKLIDLSYKFENQLNLRNAWSALKQNFPLPQIRKGRKFSQTSFGFESKLYNSQYRQRRYIYDSFIYTVRLENSKENAVVTANSNINFYVTSTVNSKFAFEYPNGRVAYCKYSVDSFPSYMIISRNNEEPIYSNAYVNYIRTGYNYDVKSKERSNMQAWFGVGLGLVGATASAATGNAFGAVNAITLTTSNLQNALGAANTTISNEQALESQQKQLQQSATSVYGSDDVDLMTRYSGNKLRLQLWEVSTEVRSQLLSLFHYFGYKTLRTGKPSKYGGRYRFNFIQCNAVFDNIGRYDKEIQDDLKQRYAEGVTYIHVNPEDEYAKWDFAQEYENWETWLIPE